MEPNPGVVEWLQKRSVSPIPRSELETWSTRQLLTRLQKLHRCMDWIDDNDIYPIEIAQVQGRILLKNTPEWNEAWRHLKELLACREHVPRAGEARVARGPVRKSGATRSRRRG